MTPLHRFEELVSYFSSHSHKCIVAIVCPSDEASRYVIDRCLNENLADFIITDMTNNIASYHEWKQAYNDRVTLLECDDIKSCADEAVKSVKEGNADVLMKGIINTDVLMHSVLNKDTGLLQSGNIMSHATLAEIPGYNRLLLFSDATVIPYPDLSQFEAMIRYDISIAQALGITVPKVALIHFTEKTNPKFPVTTAYNQIIEDCHNDKFGNVKIAGPMDVKTAVDYESAVIKGIINDVSGNADILIFPDLEAGNTFYKTISCFSHSTMAGIITGAEAPIVLPSRADTPASKFHSLVLACITAKKLK
ncbi:MAG: phosphate butyryltransferase [Paramuribaculum sp.]|nr:phosphate butyryltransferase [Paramuribaculum sp.]